MANNFVSAIVRNAEYFTKVGLKQMRWQKKILGTTVLVSRLSNEDDYKDVFGSVVQSTHPDDPSVITFEYTAVISLEDMLKLYQRNTNSLQFYDCDDVLMLGDLLTYEKGNYKISMKVTDIQTFAEGEFILKSYTCQGLTEVASEPEGVTQTDDIIIGLDDDTPNMTEYKFEQDIVTERPQRQISVSTLSTMIQLPSEGGTVIDLIRCVGCTWDQLEVVEVSNQGIVYTTQIDNNKLVINASPATTVPLTAVIKLSVKGIVPGVFSPNITLQQLDMAK